MFGGISKEDFWKSNDDGKSWILVKEKSGYPVRYGTASAILDDRLFLFGGFSSGGEDEYNIGSKSDTWMSENMGLSWIEQCHECGWYERYDHKALV